MRRSNAISEFHNYADALLSDAGSATRSRPQEVADRMYRWRSPRAALISIGFMVFGNIGMAAAANNAVPGDLLYPVDRAYESLAGLVGVDSGGPIERLEEASVLLARGEFDTAVDTIAVAATEFDGDGGAAIETLGTRLAHANTVGVDRENLHRSVAALAATVRSMMEEESDSDIEMWRAALKARTQAIADAVEGEPFVPPGQDDDFTPPGQDKVKDKPSTPPGQDDDFTPPGQDKVKDKPSTPPGQDDDFTPPGQDKVKDEKVQDDKVKDTVPPGQDDVFVPPSETEASLVPYGADGSVPLGRDGNFVPPGRDDGSVVRGVHGGAGRDNRRGNRS